MNLRVEVNLAVVCWMKELGSLHLNLAQAGDLWEVGVELWKVVAEKFVEVLVKMYQKLGWAEVVVWKIVEADELLFGTFGLVQVAVSLV